MSNHILSISSTTSVATVLNNKSASDYAKTKIQQIRKKFGYTVPSSQTNKQNNIQTPTPTNLSLNRRKEASPISQLQPLGQTNLNIQNTNIKTMDVNKNNNPKLSQLKSARNPSVSFSQAENLNISTAAQNNYLKHEPIEPKQYQYEDRIKNIDSINRKIMQMLNESKQPNAGNITERVLEKEDKDITSKSAQRRYSINKSNPPNNLYSRQRSHTPKQYSEQIPLNKIKQLEQNRISIPLSNNTTTAKKLDQELNKNLVYQQSNLNNNQMRKLNAISSNSNYNYQMNVIGPKQQKSISFAMDYQTNSISIQLSPAKPEDRQKQNLDTDRQKGEQVITKINFNKQPYSFRSPRNDNQRPSITNQNKKSDKEKERQRQRQRQRQQISKNQTIKLAKTIGDQIGLDQKLRYSKWIFSQWDNPNKWSLLQQKFNVYKFQNKPQLYSHNMSIQQLKKQFTLSPDEHNPFFQNDTRIGQNCIDQLLKNYSVAINFWLHTVNQCVTITSLQKEYFNVKDIDLGKKGYLSIQDIVCFVNLYTGKFFRNRDATTVYKRFLGYKDSQQQIDQNEGLKYEQFLDQVTK